MKFADLNIKPVSDLIPAIITDYKSGHVLMLGYMNEEAYKKTIETNKVTFYSRSRESLWTKGETSGNFLTMVSIHVDCDQDTLLIRAIPLGPTCHKGMENCFNMTTFSFIDDLEHIIQSRLDDTENPNSYVQKMKQKGLDKIAQKVGEEAVEVVIESKNDDPKAFLNESADLFFHFLLLLKFKGYTLNDIIDVLEYRHRSK